MTTDENSPPTSTTGRPMRCRSCDYPLWTLRARECPECGTSFLPSDFEYVANSVRFCCPQCDQVYYGTGRQGYVEPIEFDCVQCGNHLHMDKMVLRPAEGVPERDTTIRRMPWLERKREGRFNSWIKTVGMALVQPHQLMRAVPPESSLLQALGFALLSLVIFACSGLLSLFVVIAVIGISAAGRASVVFGILGAGAITLFIVLSLETLLASLWTLATHGMLKITGGAPLGMRRTVQALCYSSGGAALLAIPCIGTYPFGFVGAMWWMISAVIMITVGQRVHGGRATLATLAFPVLLGATLFLGYFGFLFYMFSSPATFGMMTQTTIATTDTTNVAQAVISYGSDHDGAGPAHAIMLAVEDDLAVGNFILTGGGTTEADVPIAGQTLDAFEQLPENRRREAGTTAVEALPEDVVAHRLGDFVFTYHGIDLAAPDLPNLWIVIEWPDPDVGIPPVAVVVASVDGTVESIDIGDFELALMGQNEVRALSDLPPLPTPGDVTHEQPATPD